MITQPTAAVTRTVILFESQTTIKKNVNSVVMSKEGEKRKKHF